MQAFSQRLLLLSLMLTAFKGARGLKDVVVNIPPAARTRDNVELNCKYDLEGESLYTLKWYKGPNEFYRYIPKEMPSTQLFPLPGINVDLSRSNETRIVLKDVGPEISGRYKCEVSSDAPNFYTYTVTGYMYVVDLPTEGPELTIDRALYEIGGSIRGNCTSPPSYPPINITWYLNGKKINHSNIKYLQEPNASVSKATSGRKPPLNTVSSLEVQIDKETFHGGRAELRCVASLFNLYKMDAEITLEDERPKPRPSSVLGTRDAASDAGTLLAAQTMINIAFFLLFHLR